MNPLNIKAAELVSNAYNIKIVDVLAFLEKYPDRWIMLSDSVIIFVNLNNEIYENLKNGMYDITDKGHLQYLLNQTGENVHVLGVVSNGGVKTLKFLIKFMKRRSLSWFRPDMSKLVCLEGSK